MTRRESPSSQQDGLLADVTAALEALPGVISVKQREGELVLDVERAGRKHVAALDNLLAETQDVSAESREAAIQRFVRALAAALASDLDWEEASGRLVPLLRPISIAASLPDPPLQRDFAPFLVECVAVDSDDSLQIVTAGVLERWGVSAEQVFEVARGVAGEAFADPSHVEPYADSEGAPLWYVARDDSYESSRLLMPDWLASFAPRVRGRPVAIVPHRSLLIVGGDGDHASLLRMTQTARREYDASPRKISPALYTVGDAGSVIPLVLPDEHPLAGAVALGHAVLAATEYAIQKQALDQSDEDVFVASLDADQDDEDRFYTWATWPLGVATLLPRVDRIVLMPMKDGEPDGEPLEVAWTDVERIAGNCLKPEENLDPPRFRTTSTPSAAQLAALGKAAIGT